MNWRNGTSARSLKNVKEDILVEGYSDDGDRSLSGNQLLLEVLRRDAEYRKIPGSVDADDSDGETNNSSESKDLAALMAELDRIRKERAEEKLRQEQSRAESGRRRASPWQVLKVEEEELLHGKLNLD
ncbi:hypothetical protein LINPERHAP2_LOCUS42215 [Linum perenne]